MRNIEPLMQNPNFKFINHNIKVLRFFCSNLKKYPYIFINGGIMKKQNIWALTLFSLILVLSVYYITLPNEYDVVNKDVAKTTIKEVDKNQVIETLKIENNENKLKREKELHEILTKEDASKEEKNNAYEELKALNILKSKEEELVLKIKDKFNLENYVEIKDDQIKVILIKNEHDEKLASEIMDYVQESFDEKKYISIKFEKE